MTNKECADKILELVTAYQGHSPVRDLGYDPDKDLSWEIWEILFDHVESNRN